jgi:hypothetical protein
MNQVSLNTALPKKLALLLASRNSSVNHSLPTISDLLTKTSVAAPTTLPEVLIGTESPLAQTITATNNKPTSAMAVAAITGQVTARSDLTVDYEYWPLKSGLEKRFNPSSCYIPTDEYIRQYHSQVVVKADNTDHVLHCSHTEFYLLDQLRYHPHSFENKTPLSNSQMDPRIQVQYPQSVDHLSNDVSVVRGGGHLYKKHFGTMRVSISQLCQFVCEVGDVNAKRDGTDAINASLQRRVTFGCCGQSYELVDGTNVPKETYGLDVLERYLMKLKRTLSS